MAVVIAGKTLQNPENHSTYPLFRNAALAWWDGVNVYDRNVFGGDYRYGPSFAMVLGTNRLAAEAKSAPCSGP